MKVALSSDHRGFSAKEDIKTFLQAANHAVSDFGCDGPASCDYPDTGFAGASGSAAWAPSTRLGTRSWRS